MYLNEETRPMFNLFVRSIYTILEHATSNEMTDKDVERLIAHAFSTEMNAGVPIYFMCDNSASMSEEFTTPGVYLQATEPELVHAYDMYKQTNVHRLTMRCVFDDDAHRDALCVFLRCTGEEILINGVLCKHSTLSWMKLLTHLKVHRGHIRAEQFPQRGTVVLYGVEENSIETTQLLFDDSFLRQKGYADPTYHNIVPHHMTQVFQFFDEYGECLDRIITLVRTIQHYAHTGNEKLDCRYLGRLCGVRSRAYLRNLLSDLQAFPDDEIRIVKPSTQGVTVDSEIAINIIQDGERIAATKYNKPDTVGNSLRTLHLLYDAKNQKMIDLKFTYHTSHGKLAYDHKIATFGDE